jgi:hypothetical protein
MPERIKRDVFKYALYVLLTLIVFAIQSSRLIDVQIFGAAADVMPFIVAALALYEGPYAAGGIGFLAGLLLSLHSDSLEGLDSLFLALFGVVFAMLSTMFFRENIMLCFTAGAVCLAGTELVKYVFYYYLADGVGLFAGLTLLAGKLLRSAAGGFLVCLAVRAISRRFDKEKEQ